MDPVKLLRDRVPLDYAYDDEADVLYVSLGAPRPATGIELDATVILRLDEQAGQVVGLTRIGLRRALDAELAEDGEPAGILR